MKVLFSDFYGTLVREESPTSIAVAKRILKGGNAASIEEVVGFWWADYRERTAVACGSAWRPQSELALETIENVLAKFGCDDDATELRDLMSGHWCNPLLFEDTRDFLAGVESLGIPLYFVTNSDDIYIDESIKKHGFSCSGVITSEKAKYAKPSTKIFEYALDTLGLEPCEVLHMGDSFEGDVICPASLGIQTLWLNRKGAPVPQDITAANDLDEALAIIKSLA